jgi:opacity protein-like surface antigen
MIGLEMNTSETSIYINHHDKVSYKLTAIGMDTELSDNTRVYGRYELKGGISGKANYTLLGLNNQWEIADGLRLNMLHEWSYTKNDKRPDVTRMSLSLGAEYTKYEDMKVCTKLEVVGDKSTKEKLQSLLFTGCDWKVTQDWTLLTKYRWAQIDNRTDAVIESTLKEVDISTAYRPVKYDWINVLAKYTWLKEQRPGSNYENDEQIAAIEGIFDLPCNFEMIEKFVERRQSIRRTGVGISIPEETSSITHLWIRRLNYHLTNQWDIGAEYRVLKQLESNDRRVGWLFEINRIIKDNIRIGLGYNMTDFDDNGNIRDDYSVGGWFVRLQGRY